MLFRKIASLLFAGVVAAACLTPAFGAENAKPDIGNPFPNLPETVAEIQDLQVIDRELYASYAAPAASRQAIFQELSRLEEEHLWWEIISERGEEPGLRLITLLETSGERHNYWLYPDHTLQTSGHGGVWQVQGEELATLEALLDTCQQQAPANMEWLGYMNPRRITQLRVLQESQDGERTVTLESASSAQEREQILATAQVLRQLKVGWVQRITNYEIQIPNLGVTLPTYRLRMVFEDGQEGYSLWLFNKDVFLEVDSIATPLLYRLNDPALTQQAYDHLGSLFA